jgi:hypothetical protein
MTVSSKPAKAPTNAPAAAALSPEPSPVYSDDRSTVTLYGGLLTLERVAGSPDDQPIYGAFAQLVPSLAQALLDHQNTNRNVSDATVNRYADDMINGEWELTGQGVQLDENGRNQDSQHRCNASILAHEISEGDYTPPLVLITMGYKKEAMLVVDSGLKRKTVASAKIAGYTLRADGETEITAAHDSIASGMATVWDPKVKAPNFSNHEKITYIQNNADPIEWAASRASSQSYCSNTAVRGPLAAAFARNRGNIEALFKLEQFKRLLDTPYFSDVSKGITGSEESADFTTSAFWPCLLRRDVEVGKKEKKAGQAYRHELARKACHAIHAFLNDQGPSSFDKDNNPIKKIGFKPTSPLYSTYTIFPEDSKWCDNTWAEFTALNDEVEEVIEAAE